MSKKTYQLEKDPFVTKWKLWPTENMFLAFFMAFVAVGVDIIFLNALMTAPKLTVVGFNLATFVLSWSSVICLLIWRLIKPVVYAKQLTTTLHE